MIKNEIRVLGIDDSPFDKFKKGKVLVVGVVMRGGNWLEGVMSAKVSADGNDSTGKIIKMVNDSRFKSQLRCIFLDGIAFAGLNIIDIKKVNEETNVPVIVVIRRRPDTEKIKNILIKLNKKNRIKLLENAGEIYQIREIFVQLCGVDKEKAEKILKICCTRSLLPEPLREAHLIAAGVVKGESKGRA